MTDDITKKFEATDTTTIEPININGINYVDRNVIRAYNMKTGLSKRHPKERLVTAHRKLTKEKIKLQREAELKAKAEEIKY
jgi:hypothetical protein